MNVGEILKRYLDENGFDGLCCEDCGCSKNELFPCSCPWESCEPGYKWPSEDPDCDFEIRSEKIPIVEIDSAKRDD